MTHFKNEIIWIVGASSGIGAALAKSLDKHGAILILSARSQDKLEKLSLQLKSQNEILLMDICDDQQIKKNINHIFAKYKKLNRVIVMAASYEPLSVVDMTTDHIDSIIDTNLKAPLKLVSQLLPPMRQQNTKSQIALCGSVAGYRGLPNGQPYSATKAGIKNFLESAYIELKNTNIDIKLISPGFVETPMTGKNKFEMPMIITADQAATSILKDLNNSSFEIHFPKKFTYILKFLSILPFFIFQSIAKRMS